MLLDIHTHHPLPQPEGIVSLSIASDSLSPLEAEEIIASNPSQLFSVGQHPWHSENISSESVADTLTHLALLPNVVAIGECGVDTLRGAPMFRQINVFRRHIELSESLGIPLIIHDVRAHDILLGLKRDIQPRQLWVVHGFRAKPTVTKMLVDAGCYLSFGQRFNPDSLRAVPLDRLLAETDESSLTISEIIDALEEVRDESLKEKIAENASKVIGM